MKIINTLLKCGLKKPTSKEIIQYSKENEFIKKWNSITEASKATNILKTCISDCTRGRIKSAGGFKWVLAEELKKSRWI